MKKSALSFVSGLIWLLLVSASLRAESAKENLGWIVIYDESGSVQKHKEQWLAIRGDGKKRALLPYPKGRCWWSGENCSPDGKKWFKTEMAQGGSVRSRLDYLYIGNIGEPLDTKKWLWNKGQIDDISWAPDGNILLSSGVADWERARAAFTLSLIDPQTGDTIEDFENFRKQLPLLADKHESKAIFNPDGQRILFVARGSSFSSQISGNHYLVLFDLKTKAAFVVAAFSRSIGQPHWSPDGKQVVFAASSALNQKQKNDNFEIYLWTDNYEVIQLTYSPYADSAPSWSPDGKRIVWASNRPFGKSKAVRRRLYTMNADGSRQRIFASDVNTNFTAWKSKLPVATNSSQNKN